ncbi:hypothetical protein Pla52o_27470 [Novipirellula galeiformis]|uniref:Uncharacterized protein n=1 Tax=Novipirellula galeiformis TaxID=2528004 RepID=A0A5C6CIL8_9BACT|nr:hypothetical protein [Novipirellula galeiformis]TWU23211.1 hypothetical protein Pla52o_27470 [Novipirellula galeiformis]
MTFAIADEPGNGDAPVVMPVEMFFKEMQTRKPLTFRGKLSFQDGKWGIVGRPPKSQSVFYVKSEDYKQIVSIGTFVTEDYAILIGDEEIFSLHLEAEAK